MESQGDMKAHKQIPKQHIKPRHHFKQIKRLASKEQLRVHRQTHMRICKHDAQLQDERTSHTALECVVFTHC